jgi:hypothetical protein
MKFKGKQFWIYGDILDHLFEHHGWNKEKDFGTSLRIALGIPEPAPKESKRVKKDRLDPMGPLDPLDDERRKYHFHDMSVGDSKIFPHHVTKYGVVNNRTIIQAAKRYGRRNNMKFRHKFLVEGLRVTRVV